MSKKRTSAEANSDYKQTNEDAESLLQKQDNDKRAKLSPVSDAQIQDLPIELLEYILVKVVAMEVKDLKLAKSVWKDKADEVINRLRPVSSPWNSILTSNSYRSKLERTLDINGPETIRLEVLHESSIRREVEMMTSLGDYIYMCCTVDIDNQFHAVEIYTRGNMEEPKDVIPLPGSTPLRMIACTVSNCVYLLIRIRNCSCLSVLRICEEAADICEEDADEEDADNCEEDADQEDADNCEEDADEEDADNCEEDADEEDADNCEEDADEKDADNCEEDADEEDADICEEDADIWEEYADIWEEYADIFEEEDDICEEVDENEFTILPWPYNHRLPLTGMSVAANGNVLVLSWQDRPAPTLVSIYDADGALQRDILLPLNINALGYHDLLQKSNGNLVVGYSSNPNSRTILLEIDMNGIVVRQYASRLGEWSWVNFADNYDRIMITVPFKRMELLDSEFNLVGVYALQQDEGQSLCLHDLHIEREFDDILRIHCDWFTGTKFLTLFRFTAE